VELFFAVAAVADYAPATVHTQKMKKTNEKLRIDLVPTMDILSWVASQPNSPFCVGFAAESENVIEHARNKRERKKIQMIVANLATTAIGAEENEVTILDRHGDYPIPRGPKAQIARLVVAHASRLFTAQTPSRPSLRSVKNA
jgi:phosphopantothenoylcysteine decarboxylase/phosphopantothenate--cysteine ligase